MLRIILEFGIIARGEISPTVSVEMSLNVTGNGSSNTSSCTGEIVALVWTSTRPKAR
jgi:hypothetical protein